MNYTRLLIAVFFAVFGLAASSYAQDNVFRIGIVGLDTSHVTSFTKYINDPQNNTACKVVAGYAGGSPDIETSIGRVAKFTRELRENYKIEIVDSIEELCTKVDGVLLESVDGRVHLEQLKLILAAGKPVFIDKPIAASLSDALEIFRLANEAGVPCWSSSSLRFSPDFDDSKTKYGRVLGCSTYSPCHLEPHHPDLYWYGVHGVELLFTMMGPGCETVHRIHTQDTDVVVGVWNDGRIGTYRGLRGGKTDYGGTVFGATGIGSVGAYAGYVPLLKQIVTFFKTGVAPVKAEETIEIFAFMTAADESKAQNGSPVSLQSVIEKAKKNNEKP